MTERAREGHSPIVPAASRRCYVCSHAIELDSVGRLATCEKCGAYLHCCRNCGLYDSTAYNQCREPQAERQLDKEAGNFCEYFIFRHGAAEAERESSTRARLEALFAKR